MTQTALGTTMPNANTGLLVTASAMPHMSPTAVAAVIGSFELAFVAAHEALTLPPDPFGTRRRHRDVRATPPILRVLGASYRNPTEMSVLAGIGTELSKQTVSLLEFICNWGAKRRLLNAQADKAESEAELARLEVEARRREVYGLTHMRALPVSVGHLAANKAALREAQPTLPRGKVLAEWRRETTGAAVRAGVDPENAQLAFDRVDVLHAIQLLGATGLTVQVVTPEDASAWEPPR